MKDLSKKKVIKRVNQIIKQYYLFMGYIGFANYIDKMSSLKREIKDQNKRKVLVQKKMNYLESLEGVVFLVKLNSKIISLKK